MSNVPFGVYIAVLLGLATLSGVGAVVSVAIEEWRHMSTANQLARWRKLYKKEFGIELGDAVIPKRMRDFDFLIVVAAGIMLWQVLTVLRKYFAVHVVYRDPDFEIVRNERTNTTTYAIWVRARVEADEGLANESAGDMEGIPTMTLLERLLHELAYFTETGEHLDIGTVTLCSGSSLRNDGVFGVNYNNDKHTLFIDSFGPCNSHASLRARQVIAA